MSSSKLTWQAYDRALVHRGPDWYWAVSIVALSIAVTAILLHNTLFAILVVISTVSLFLRTLQAPRLVSYELTNRGLWTGKTFEAFSTFSSFYVTKTEPAKLILKSKGLFTPLSVISLPDISPELVSDFLFEYLPEEELQEPLAKRIMEYLRF